MEINCEDCAHWKFDKQYKPIESNRFLHLIGCDEKTTEIAECEKVIYDTVDFGEIGFGNNFGCKHFVIR